MEAVTCLVLFRGIALGADQNPDDARVAVPGRGVERTVAVLKPKEGIIEKPKTT